MADDVCRTRFSIASRCNHAAAVEETAAVNTSDVESIADRTGRAPMRSRNASLLIFRISVSRVTFLDFPPGNIRIAATIDRHETSGFLRLEQCIYEWLL